MPREYFKLIPAVYLVLRKDNQVLLLRRANTGYQDGNYSLVAGHIESDELATEAMVREAKEEAGITIAANDLTFVHVSQRLNRGEANQERIDLFFETSNWQGQVKNMEPDRCDELAWYDINDLPSNTIPFIKNVLDDINQQVTYSQYYEEPN